MANDSEIRELQNHNWMSDCIAAEGKVDLSQAGKIYSKCLLYSCLVEKFLEMLPTEYMPEFQWFETVSLEKIMMAAGKCSVILTE